MKAVDLYSFSRVYTVKSITCVPSERRRVERKRVEGGRAEETPMISVCPESVLREMDEQLLQVRKVS